MRGADCIVTKRDEGGNPSVASRIPRPHRAGIYIDLENLGRDVQVSQNIIRYALEHWPAQYPPLSVIALYGPQRPGL